MSTVTTANRVNVSQLTLELDAGITVSDDGATRTITCHDESVTQEQLQAVIDAHVPVDETGNRSTIETQAVTALQANRDDITDNNTFLAIASPTNAQTLAQVKALTRQSTRQARELNALIRLALGKLDATD